MPIPHVEQSLPREPPGIGLTFSWSTTPSRLFERDLANEGEETKGNLTEPAKSDG
jgi:hypothetical protein